MSMIKRLAVCFGATMSLFLGFVVTAAPAQAQATRTWVSGVGDDVNPCSRTAPCKTFAGAISKTAAGGEINCLDPAGYGTVTLTKSITIDCRNTHGSILASGGINGVVLNDSATASPNSIKVILRGLSINGTGTTPGNSGVNFVSGASLTITDCVIQNFGTTSAVGVRVAVSGTAAAVVRIRDTLIVNNGAPGVGGGINVAPTGTSTVRLTLENVSVLNGTAFGLRIDTTGNTGAGVRAMVAGSTLAGATAGVVAFQPAGAAPVTVMVRDTTIDGNSLFGLLASGVAARIRIGDSVITNNGTAASGAGGGVVNSYGNNEINGNTTSDGTFTAIPLS